MNTATLAATTAHAATILPAIGAAFEGGVFAGITLHEDRLHALVLLPGDVSKYWRDAMTFAEEQDATLPPRIDMLVLYKNLPKEFKRDWYWTSEVRPGFAVYAFVQAFAYGNQFYGHEGSDGRARAVRRVAL